MNSFKTLAVRLREADHDTPYLFDLTADGAELIDELATALTWMVAAYIDVCGSNTSEGWDARSEPEVQKAIALLTEVSPTGGRMDE